MIERFVDSLKSIVGENFSSKYYLLAVSGGADSSVMTAIFHQLGLNFAIAHCNFHLRGADSDRDMEFVKSMSEKLNVRLYLQEFDTLSIQKQSGKSVEMVARQLRYEWFEQIWDHFDYLVTAHNSNDLAETTILNITRGASLKGLCSIPVKNGKIIRPMTVFSANEIRNFAKNNNISFVVDYTNSDQTIVRNKIRHSVIPVLESINPNFLNTYNRNQDIINRQYKFYQQNIKTVVDTLIIRKDQLVYIDKTGLFDSSDPQLILFEILSEYNFSEDTVNKLSYKNIPSGRKFYSKAHLLIVEREFFIVKPLEDNDNNLCINILTLDELKQYFFIEEFSDRDNIVFDNNSQVLYIPKEKLKFPLVLRTWREGDYFYPLGVKGRKKLSDYFNNAKIDNVSKKKIQLLCHNDEIIWIIGYRTDERFKIDKQTEKFFRIETKNEK